VLSPAHAEWPRRREVIRAGLAELDPDVLAVQEVAEDLSDRPGAWHSQRSPDGVGAALYSRWPITGVQELDLRLTTRVDLPWCATVVAEIDAPFGPLLVAHHKPTYQYGYAVERELQSVAAARFIEKIAWDRDVHVILTGDFDDTPDSSSIRFWTGRQSLDGISVAYHDATDGQLTFTPDNPLVAAGEMPLEPGRRIDYVMVRCGTHGPTLRTVSARRVFDRPVDGIWPSDHFGVLAEFAVPEEGSEQSSVTHAPGSEDGR
jgi:endonuclease/exonuclease/phosphatase family metal-dependent hydrolase